jgi:hypothetical protein
VATVTTALVGQHTFYIDIVYSGSMRMNSTPTVSLAPTDGDPTEAQDIASTLTLNSDYSGWVGDGLTYKAVYDVAASNVIVQEVNVLVSGGLDAVGNPPASYSGTNVFNINTAPAPGAVPASPSAASLADAVLSSGALHLTVGTSTVPADQQPAINPVDAALLYTGTWLNA